MMPAAHILADQKCKGFAVGAVMLHGKAAASADAIAKQLIVSTFLAVSTE